jgi:hypothetical protein
MLWMLASAGLQAVSQIGAARVQRATDKANNKAIRAYNDKVATQAAQSFSEINLQKAALSQQVAQALASTQRQGLVMSAERGAQAAATDTTGASVDQNLSDVQSKVAEAKSTYLYNEAMSDASLNAQAQSVATQAGQSIRAETAVTNVWGAALGQAAASIGMSMLGNMGSLSSTGTGATQSGYTSSAFKTYTSRNNGLS